MFFWSKYCGQANSGVLGSFLGPDSCKNETGSISNFLTTSADRKTAFVIFVISQQNVFLWRRFCRYFCLFAADLNTTRTRLSFQYWPHANSINMCALVSTNTSTTKNARVIHCNGYFSLLITDRCSLYSVAFRCPYRRIDISKPNLGL